MKKLLYIVCVAASAAGAFAGGEYSVFSPDSDIEFRVSTQGELKYSLFYKGRQLIEPSQMGFELQFEKPMTGGFEPLSEPVAETGLVEEWTPVVRNKHREVRLEYSRLVLKLRESAGARRRMDVTVHVYDGGAAFKYTLYAGDRPCERRIQEELTEFKVPAGSFAWVGKNQGGGGFEGSQESRFDKTPVENIGENDWCFSPLLVEVDKSNYLAFTSAYLNDYPGFFTAYRTGALVTRLVPSSSEREQGVKAKFDHKFDTAWRVIFAGDTPGRFIESEIIHALNPPCAIADTSWIKPGISAWDHWWSGEVKMEMPVIKEYIDFASVQGWPYMLIDWQWYGPFNTPEADITKTAPQIDMPELLEYAKARNVRLWLWLYCADANLNDAYVEAFALYEKWGIAGVKIDFMDRYDRECVNWCRRFAAAAAEHHLMLDFHGAFAPDGLDRTYPNQLTREGVLGEEYSKFSFGPLPLVTPDHNVTLAFTRMLAGHMDYTPGGFINVEQGKHRAGVPAVIMNTRCAELAKFVVYDSPWTVFCDHPTNVVGKAGSDFLKTVKTEWDDTRFLGGAPDEWIALAKRDGERWFVGVMGGVDAREVEVDLSALGCGKNIEYWADGENGPEDVVHAKSVLGCGKLKINLAPGGGYVAIVE
ncbi:MAG: glycoside hydrolase family 97 protein [Kiritimatiellae bacterium]|nr:glycoside hydrolase family 97 protein [Kiritimatiellia bacterium]